MWSGTINRRPALVARCTGVADVMRAVDFARTQHVLTAIRGGAHNVAGTGTCDGGLVIDLSPMKGIRVDPAARRVRAQPGVVWRELDRETQAFGLAVTGGLVSTTGIAGFTLGGGIGWLVRRCGMTCDNLVAADVVTADGQLVVANEMENAELLWGLRGGGGNFGVVTSLEYALHQVGPVIGGLVIYSAADARTVLSKYRTLVGRRPGRTQHRGQPVEYPAGAIRTARLARQASDSDPGLLVGSNPPGRGHRRAVPVAGPADRRRHRSDALHSPADDARPIVAKGHAHLLAVRLPAGAVRRGDKHTARTGVAERPDRDQSAPPGRCRRPPRRRSRRLPEPGGDLRLQPAGQVGRPGRGRGLPGWARSAHEHVERFGTGAAYLNFLPAEGRSRSGPRSAPAPTPGWSHSRTATTRATCSGSTTTSVPAAERAATQQGGSAMGVINRDNVPVTIKDNNVELRLSEASDLSVSFVRLQQGTDLAPALAGLPGDLCPCPHWGYMLKGRLAMKTRAGDEVYEAGQAFYWPPGHAPRAIEDCEYVDFSPTQEFAVVIRHITGGS